MDIEIRKYVPDERIGDVAKLVYNTEPEVFQSVYGSEERGIEILKNLIKLDGNDFGFGNIFVARSGNGIAGTLVGYDWKRMAEFRKTSVKTYMKATGFFGSIGMILRVVTGPVRFLDENLPEGHYYISDISIRPEFRGQGIGSKLIARAEKEAIAEGCRTIRLAVWYDNPGAKKLYERLGFVEYGRREGKYKGKTVGFYHLEKPLTGNI